MKLWRLPDVCQIWLRKYLFDMLTIISSRICKKTFIREVLHFKTQQSRTLLDILQSSKRFSKMSTYNNCVNTGIPFCEVFLQKSSRYIEYIRLNRSGYNVLSYSPAELLAIFRQYQKAETKFEETMEWISYLLKQKKM